MAETFDTDRYNNYALSCAIKLFSKYFAIEMLVCMAWEKWGIIYLYV